MKAGSKIAVLVAVAVIWAVLDRWTKSLFAHAQPGEMLGSALGGLVDFRLVHNTGAAWGIFANGTTALGVFSIVVVAMLVIYFFWNLKRVNLAQTLGLALVAAGGVGNAIDRFSQGYVTDFIAVTFVDFPVFNVADIGVTCGVVIFFIGLVFEWRREGGGARKDDSKSSEMR